MHKIYFTGIGMLLSFFAIAQVAVKDEPRHHNVFENDHIRILNVFIPPHDTTEYHLHNTPSVFIVFTNTNVSSQLIGKQPQKGANIIGQLSYDNLNTPRTHRVWNEDTSWFHVMDIELIGGKPKSNQPVLTNSFLQLVFNAPLANGYYIEPGKNFELPATEVGYLLLSTGDAVLEYKTNGYIQRRIMKSGHYLWIEPGNPFSINSAGNGSNKFVLLQLK